MRFTPETRAGSVFLSGLAVFFGILFWTGCSMTIKDPVKYKLTYPEHVWLAQDLSEASSGDTILVFVNPPAGQKLKSLSINGGTPIVPSNPHKFSMPSQDVVIDAQWSDLAQGEFSVTLRHSPNGRSYVNPTYGKNGESITLVLMPEFLYQYDSFTEPPQDLVKVDEKTFTFPMPSRNLTLEPKFRTIDPPNSLEPAESFFLTKPQGFHKL